MQFWRRGSTAERRAPPGLADSLRQALRVHDIEVWYPRVVDTEHGGFLSRFGRSWRPRGSQEKMIVTQARHVWATARLAGFDPDRAVEFAALSDHGVAFLRDAMWDHEYGGFVTEVARDGTLAYPSARRKTAYGQAFALVGLAERCAIGAGPDTFELARSAFRWLDDHAHDAEHGGYFQYLEPDGTPRAAGWKGEPPKDSNSSIHLLGALIALHRVWPDPTVRARLEEMLSVVRDSMVGSAGYLRLGFARDFVPFAYTDRAAARADGYRRAHRSFGHDLETAVVILDAVGALGLVADASTRGAARGLVDGALESGWDAGPGGFFQAAHVDPRGGAPEIVIADKTWWVQAEALPTLLLAADAFPEGRERYLAAFRETWAYIRAHLLDWKHGGWFARGLDRSPGDRRADKAHIWKGPFHTVRTLTRSIEWLESREAS